MISKDFEPESNDETEADGVEEQPEKLPKEIYIIAQEVKIVKALASNDPKQRAKQLRKLRKWFLLRSNSTFPFSTEDFMRIWKGLYYCMWMSDKPLVQEELAEDLGKLIECFSDISTCLRFFGAFMQTMCVEWFGIDQWRMDKMLMCVRRILRYTFRAMKKEKWSSEAIEELNVHVTEVLNQTALGLSMHLLDIFFEELAKVAEGDITGECVAEFLQPFIRYMAHQNELKLLAHMRKHVFEHLMYQSELGREYSEKYNAWKEMGFPTSHIDDLEKDDSDAESEPETKPKYDGNHLDPRAGNVDVFMPILPVNAAIIAAKIETIIYKEETNTKSRKFLKAMLENYKKFQTGVFPLGIKTMPKIQTGPQRPMIDEKMSNLDQLEDEMFATTRKIKKLNKRDRKRLLAQIKYDDATEDNLDQLIEDSLPKHLSEGKNKRKSVVVDSWLEEEIETVPEKIKKVEKKQETNTTLFKEKPTKGKKLKKNKPEVKAVVASPTKAAVPAKSEWDEELQDGEIEYFVPAKKIQVKQANENLSSDIVINPFAKAEKSPKTPKKVLLGKSTKLLKAQSAKANKLPNGVETPLSEAKRVKIVLKKNTAQKQSEYFKQLMNSPDLPYDANKKPSKGLLKPNLMPSPINPFYKKKIGFKMNDTL